MTGKQFAREVAKRLFAHEFGNSKTIEKSGTDEFEPRYIQTELGDKVNRVFICGTITEVENVGKDDEIIRARIVDPTGVFVIYASHYQLEARADLEKIKVPEYVAIVGKVNAYSPPNGDTTILSIRPESVGVIDERTRNHWVAETSRLTLERVSASQASGTIKQQYIDLANAAMISMETAS